MRTAEGETVSGSPLCSYVCAALNHLAKQTLTFHKKGGRLSFWKTFPKRFVFPSQSNETHSDLKRMFSSSKEVLSLQRECGAVRQTHDAQGPG